MFKANLSRIFLHLTVKALYFVQISAPVAFLSAIFVSKDLQTFLLKFSKLKRISLACDCFTSGTVQGFQQLTAAVLCIPNLCRSFQAG
jgi:hypothetical protein